jgi:hypothetical protein
MTTSGRSCTSYYGLVPSPASHRGQHPRLPARRPEAEKLHIADASEFFEFVAPHVSNDYLQDISSRGTSRRHQPAVARPMSDDLAVALRKHQEKCGPTGHKLAPVHVATARLVNDIFGKRKAA